jgi:hypothetical protein
LEVEARCMDNKVISRFRAAAVAEGTKLSCEGTEGAQNYGATMAYKGLGGGRGLVCRYIAFEYRIHTVAVVGSNSAAPPLEFFEHAYAWTIAGSKGD